MKTRLRIYTNKNKDYFNELFYRSYIQCDMVKKNMLSIEDVDLTNSSYKIEKGSTVKTDNYEFEFLKEKIYKVEDKVYPNIDSFIVLNAILNIGKEIDKFIRPEDMNNIDKHSALNEYDFYKKVIKDSLGKGDNLFYFVNRILKLILSYGSVTTPSIDNRDDRQVCNVLDFLCTCYLIYECYYLIYYAKEFKENKITLFNYYRDKKYMDKHSIFDYVTKTLKYLNSCTTKNLNYESKFDEENERWITTLVFEDVLALAIYELRIQLSDDSETSVGICKNKTCGSTFIRKSKKQEYCSRFENIDCYISRQYQRKKKSLGIKNNSINPNV